MKNTIGIDEGNKGCNSRWNAALLALNREAFEEKIWDEIICNNKMRKNNLPMRREDILVFIITMLVILLLLIEMILG